MDTTLSVAKTTKGISLSLIGPPTVVIIKAQLDTAIEYHIERFEHAKDKVIPYPSDLFKTGYLQTTTYALVKDSGTMEGSDRVCRDCAAIGIYSCEHVSPGDWVLGKEESKKQPKSKKMDELGYGSAALSAGETKY